METSLQEPTRHQRRERLSKMIDWLGLEDIYDAMIEQIKGKGGYKLAHGIATLMWISYAEELLIPGELCYAVAAESGSTDFNVSNIPCQGLIQCSQRAR